MKVEPLKGKLLRGAEGGIPPDWFLVKDVKSARELFIDLNLKLWKEGKLCLTCYQRVGTNFNKAFPDLIKKGV